MKHLFLTSILGLTIAAEAQITILGRNVINNSPVLNTRIWVKDGANIIQTVNTVGKSEFKLKLEFGRNYHVYFHNPRSPVMHMEVMAAQVPEPKQYYNMIYKLDIQLVDKTDEDIDTLVFKKPFHRAIFDGNNRMIDDTVYNQRFARNMFRKEEPVAEVKNTPTELPVIMAGRVMLQTDRRIPVCNKPITALNASGSIIASTATNRYGAFSFAGVKLSEIKKIRMDIPEKEAGTMKIALQTSKRETVIATAATNGYCDWELDQPAKSKLVDNNYTTNVGGKLISASGKGKKFFANKDVFLSNRLNTVVKRTKTNTLGSFVFEDIRPDNQYFIGVSQDDLTAGERIDLISKDDKFIKTLDTVAGNRASVKFKSDYNQLFNDLSIADDEMKMDVSGMIFGDNVNQPIGKLKIVLLNDNYEVIDSSITDNLGTFRFKYLPFLKRFFLSAENTENMLDVFKNILIYSADDNLIKIMTHQKGKKFTYNPVNAEITSLRDIELDDPWLDLLETKKTPTASAATAIKSIIENVLFEYNKYEITAESREILDKVVVVLGANKALKIEIGAHTDSKGSETSNLKLSEMRAKTVQIYIVSSGVEPSRIMSRGYGESKLLNDCSDNKPCSELEHAVNRRIEFRILGE